MQYKKPSRLLWLVTWTHRSGVQAPTQFIEFDPEKRHARKNALLLAKQQSRLGDFPEKWSCKIINLSDPTV